MMLRLLFWLCAFLNRPNWSAGYLLALSLWGSMERRRKRRLMRRSLRLAAGIVRDSRARYKFAAGMYAMGWTVYDSQGRALITQVPASTTTSYDLKAWGAKGDMVQLTDAAMTAGSTTVTSASAPFTSTAIDNGKPFGIGGTQALADPTTAPTNAASTAAANANMPNGSYTFAYAYVNLLGTGETKASATSTSITTTGTNPSVVVTFGTIPANVSGVKIYVIAGPGAAQNGYTGITATTGTSITISQANAVTVPRNDNSTGPMLTSIVSVTSSTSAVLANAATLTVTGQRACFGTDDTTIIKSVCDAARLAGGAQIYAPPGRYMVSPSYQSSVGTALPNRIAIPLGSGCTIRGAGRGATIFAFAPMVPATYDGAGSCTIFGSYTQVTDHDITLEDFSIDGNGFLQGDYWGMNGGLFYKCTHLKINRLFIYDVYSSPNSEQSAFQIVASSICTVDNVDSNEHGLLANGFAISACTGINLRNVTHTGTAGNWRGLVMDSCNHCTWTACWSYLNTTAGGSISHSLSTSCAYIQCVSGGTANPAENPFGNPYPFTNGQNLGSTGSGPGFDCSGGGDVNYIGCVSVGNTGDGIIFQGTAGQMHRLIGGRYESNTGVGVRLNSASMINNVSISNHPRIVSNTGGQLWNSQLSTASSSDGPVTGPAVGTTGVAVTNPFASDGTVYIKPGAATCSVSTDGTATGVTMASGGIAQGFRVRPGGTITWTSTATPTWQWVLD